MTPNSPTPMFHHPMFTRAEVIVLTNKHAHNQPNAQTNKQTDAAENIQRSSLGNTFRYTYKLPISTQ